jgi:hypothetical protein
MSKPTNRRKTGKAIQINPADDDHVVSGAGGELEVPPLGRLMLVPCSKGIVTLQKVRL